MQQTNNANAADADGITHVRADPRPLDNCSCLADTIFKRRMGKSLIHPVVHWRSQGSAVIQGTTTANQGPAAIQGPWG